ncbi:hypothetical protein [Pseudomonas abietaniphila]|uniref:hypothetical protein n=1 Tax=Pseudomonas abietaniphila TaxID=89065 RepID=UPI000AD3A449|nr:hypothetical protein [Pseudomonas abietaniphila]
MTAILFSTLLGNTMPASPYRLFSTKLKGEPCMNTLMRAVAVWLGEAGAASTVG